VIRYLSTHDNQYIRYFSGHTSTVTCLALSPSSDTFVSCSTDNTVKLWSLSTPNPSGALSLTTPHLSAFDPSASVLAIASPSTNTLLLYDLRNYDKAPFGSFDILPLENRFLPLSASQPTRAAWTKVEFSNNGTSLLLATAGGGHFVLDAFSGKLKAFCARKQVVPPQLARLPPGSARAGGVQGQGDVCFSPDGRYLLGGAGAENLLVWDTYQKPQDPDHPVLLPLHELPTKTACSLVAFNPRFNMCVTANKEVVMWVPDKNALSD
jgi:COMPASS component SWD2